mmetsp:Transcript_24638/g.57835  ORF Transcript_24638/g.57835 Transcript_24638/m.57835 type:complete len:495 (-) Transcript_24638:369-1853(-)|eukprot:CAMPEP_0197195920 /NCGR_PEP_ID=MMETSP1423-20130617/32077_1 /TAXON_ID=476441 /ORGANISM="Pseudo-nitzschia heimii, Strain UNC1101" /LENGTH=494 /DNA_ID=CAMNT_0042649683 /DNA_START=198 /DNA_END=1682 /DNA_ORIENTATION=-
MEIEINFRFDENGRTANTKIVTVNDNDTSSSDNRVAQNEMDYGFRAAVTSLKESFETSPNAIDDILLDCEISDNLIMPRTYWTPVDGKTKARCALEQFALDIFNHHVPSTLEFDRETSGAEWWCQLRPSPETGRHSAVAKQEQKRKIATSNSNDDTNNDEDNDPFTNGISFHVDKDEELRILTGGSTYVHPHLSTITYLTNLGSPTLIADCQVHPLTGEWMVPDSNIEGFVSWPSVGKHTSFDGRFLHASPLDLMGENNTFDRQIESEKARLEQQQGLSEKSKRRRCRRVTFLVNIWLNYRPYDVNPFPESMIDKMSGRNDANRIRMAFETAPPSTTISMAVSPPSSECASSKPLTDTNAALHVQKWSIRSDQATQIDCASPRSSTSSSLTGETRDLAGTQQFSWPLGDSSSGEKLECFIPMSSMTEASKNGGNVRFQWQTTPETTKSSFRLFDCKSSPPPFDSANASPTAVIDETVVADDAPSNKRPRVQEAT